MVRDLGATTGRSSGATRSERELATKTSRWKLSGLVVDWRDYDRIYDEAGLIPPKDHTPIQDEYYVYDDDLNQLGYATSQMYSPMLQRHIALARVPLDRTAPGSRVKLELRGQPPLRVLRRARRPHPPVQPRAKDRLTCRRPKKADGRGTSHARRQGHLEGRPDVRRDRHRWRAQRPDERRVPREGRACATLVLERRHLVGGAAITEELRPGFWFTTFSYALSLLRPDIIHELELVKHGFMPILMPTTFCPKEDGDYLLLGQDHGENHKEIARHIEARRRRLRRVQPRRQQGPARRSSR